MQENPWAYQEARNRIREKQEQEVVTLNKKREEFEIGKEKVYSKKKLDVYELKRKIETGHSLSLLKDDIQQALDEGSISIDTYQKAIDAIDHPEETVLRNGHEYLIDPEDFPLGNTQIARYFESKKLGENLFVDVGGFAFGMAQGSVFLLYLLGKIILDFLLLPRDIYNTIKS